jgi:excisionase family DNA binding protein
MRRENSDNNLERLLSPKEVARVCGLSRRAVYGAIARGELPAARLCNRLRVRPAELERWIGDRTIAQERPRPRRSSPAGASASRGGLRAMLDQAGEG